MTLSIINTIAKVCLTPFAIIGTVLSLPASLFWTIAGDPNLGLSLITTPFLYIWTF